MSQQNFKKIWLGLVIILLILFTAGWQLYKSHFQHGLESYSNQSKKELIFISGIIHKYLQNHDYQPAKSFIVSWGERSSDIAEISLTTKNEFKLAHYNGALTPAHELVQDIDIAYSYDGISRLKIRRSLDEVYKSNKNFIYELIAGYLFIALILYYLIHTIVRTQKQKQALAYENKQRVFAENELAKSLAISQLREQNLEVTLNSIGDAVIATDANGMVVRMNPVAEKLTGWSLQDAKGQSVKSIFCIIDASTREVIDNPVEKVLLTGKTIYLSNHTLLIAKDGTEYHITDSAAPIRKDDDNILGMVLVFNDVSERKQAEEKIRTLLQAIEQSPVSVMITDTDANIEYVNSTFEKNTGYPMKEVLGQNPRILKSGNTPKQLYQELWQTISSGNTWHGEVLNRKKNGDLFWESAHIAPVLNESGDISHYLAVREDITLRKHQDEKILHQAHFDALTDLPNRFLSLDRLSQLISEAERNSELVAVLFLDLDDFKKINDTLGHDIGDKLLVEAAARLQNEIRSGDTVGRLGGDEFIVLLGGLTDASDASPVVENLLNRFRDSFRIDGRELVLTASIGIAIFPDDGSTSSELLRNADSAMYYSKDDGRNTYSYFTKAMNQNVSRRLALEEQMHGALDRGEFQLFYQPKINIANSKIVGVEALLRWHNPTLGEISPDEFISIAEQTGLIVPIGEFVLTEALTMTPYWQNECGGSFTVAVNLSPRQFRDPNLVPFIERSLSESGIMNKTLELEITEGVLMSGHGYIAKALKNINTLGINIAMDDFGTGYSSLSYLRKYPFDVLKIDRSFVNDITVDKADRELVNAAIAMAHSLGLKVVAEGVETEEQLALLADQGCDIAQGYLFSKPVPADKISEMIISAKNK
jgi:diguanylate cyclase (GGDEF)-like protein/PAS domain S-box-containing protein